MALLISVAKALGQQLDEAPVLDRTSSMTCCWLTNHRTSPHQHAVMVDNSKLLYKLAAW